MSGGVRLIPIFNYSCQVSSEVYSDYSQSERDHGGRVVIGGTFSREVSRRFIRLGVKSSKPFLGNSGRGPPIPEADVLGLHPAKPEAKKCSRSRRGLSVRGQ